MQLNSAAPPAHLLDLLSLTVMAVTGEFQQLVEGLVLDTLTELDTLVYLSGVVSVNSKRQL
jgi:hypothetical protein